MSGSLTAAQLDRAEELQRKPSLTPAERGELSGLRELARSLTGPAEVADDPRTPFVDEARRPMLHGVDDPSTPEDESDYLGAQLSRDARAREAWLRKAWEALWHALGPLVLQFGQAAIGAALAKLPHDVLIPGLVKLDLAPVVSAVEVLVLDAAAEAIKKP